MCIAVPAKVIKIYDNEALVVFKGVKVKTNTSLIDNLKIGEYILLHAGCAIQKIDQKEAEKTMKLYEYILKRL